MQWSNLAPLIRNNHTLASRSVTVWRTQHHLPYSLYKTLNSNQDLTSDKTGKQPTEENVTHHHREIVSVASSTRQLARSFPRKNVIRRGRGIFLDHWFSNFNAHVESCGLQSYVEGGVDGWNSDRISFGFSLSGVRSKNVHFDRFKEICLKCISHHLSGDAGPLVRPHWENYCSWLTKRHKHWTLPLIRSWFEQASEQHHREVTALLGTNRKLQNEPSINRSWVV